jgi:hypothetical protein
MERPHLTLGDQQQLAAALLNCDCIRDRPTRNLVVQTLQRDVLGQDIPLTRHENNDRADVIAVLGVITRQSGGLHKLLACIELFEPGTEASGHLRRLVERMEPDPPLSPEQSAALEELLAEVNCVEGEELYWEAVGEFGPAPAVPGHDLVSLARELLDVNSSGSWPPLLIFLHLVAERTVTHRAELLRCIDELAPIWSVDPRELARQRSALVERPVPTGDCYLVLWLEAFGANPEHYLVTARFQRAGRSKTLISSDEPMPIEELAEVLDHLVSRDPEVTRDAVSRLVVELVVPRKVIGRDFDQWPIAPAGFSRPIGVQHPLVVRPAERLDTPALHRQWRRKWAWLKEHGHDPRMSVAATHWIRSPSEVNPLQLMIQMMVPDTPVRIVLGFAPPPANDLSSDEYAAAVHSGAPAIIWCRDGRSADAFESELRRLIDDHALLVLPDLIHRYRQEAHYPDAQPNHLGRHLTLVWDDFDRKPEDFDRLAAPVRGTV